MTPVHGMRLPSCKPDDISDSIVDVLSAAALDCPGRVILIPDVHYPYHPSTGTVTNSDTVESVANYLLESGGVERVEVARPATSWDDDESCATYLGYDRTVDRSHVRYFDPDSEPQVSRTVTVKDQETVVTAPLPVLENALVVPTLRRTADATLVGCFDRLAATALGREPTAFEIDSFAAAADPIGAILDATYSYGGTPHKTRAVLASDDAFAVERVAAYLLGLDTSVLPVGATEGDQPTRVYGLDAHELAAAIPDEPISEGTPSRLMKSGYQLYTRVTGDQLPPQLMDQ
ncbi:MAG: DUF362 domain-containing protein [Halobacteriota archaeon]